MNDIVMKDDVEFIMPLIPNFIKHKSSGKWRDIVDFSDQDLIYIGLAWMTELLNMAKKRKCYETSL